MASGVPQLHRRYHMDSCCIRALAFMWDTPIIIARDNFYLYDRRLHISERRYINRHCTCAESARKGNR